MEKHFPPCLWTNYLSYLYDFSLSKSIISLSKLMQILSRYGYVIFSDIGCERQYLSSNGTNHVALLMELFWFDPCL